MSKQINFLEAEFFSNFVDMEKWVKNYIATRKELRPIYTQMGLVTGLTARKSKTAVWGYLMLYCDRNCCFQSFFNISWYMAIWEQALVAKQYLLIFNMLVWPLLFAVGALLALVKTSKITDAHRFLEQLEQEGIKIAKG